MEPRAHHVLIGLFTVVTIGAALIFALWLGKSSADSEFNHYEVLFTEAVSGLSTGSAVQYSGIRIGEVTALGLDPQDPRKVHATIRVTASTPIKQDTRARLTLTNITGGSVIQLHGGSPESPLLQGKKGALPVIVADPSPLARLMANGEDLMLNVTRLLNRANNMFSAQNAERVTRTLENLEKATASVAGERDNLHEALVQISNASREANALMRNANSLLDQRGQQAFDNAERLMGSLENSSRQIEHLLDDNRDALDSGLRSIGELGPAIDELRDTLDALRSFSKRLEEDPAGYLLRSDTIEEFRP